MEQMIEASTNQTASNKSVEVSLFKCDQDFDGYSPDLNLANRYLALLGVIAILLVATVLYGLLRQYLLRGGTVGLRNRRDPAPPARELVIALPERIGKNDCE